MEAKLEGPKVCISVLQNSSLLPSALDGCSVSNVSLNEYLQLKQVAESLLAQCVEMADRIMSGRKLPTGFGWLGNAGPTDGVRVTPHAIKNFREVLAF